MGRHGVIFVPDEGSKREVRMEWSSRSFALIVKIGHSPKERRENFFTRIEVRRMDASLLFTGIFCGGGRSSIRVL